jgi:hypothetical protein
VPEPSAPEPSDPEEPTEQVAREPARAGASLALVVGPGLDRGPLRIGGSLRGFVRPRPWPVAPTLGLAVARSGGEATLLWLAGSLGLLGRLEVAGPLALEGRAELVGQLLNARAQDPITREQDADGRLRLGAQLGLELHLALGQGFALFVGGEGAVLRPSVSLDVGGEPAGEAGLLSAAGLAGVRFAR